MKEKKPEIMGVTMQQIKSAALRELIKHVGECAERGDEVNPDKMYMLETILLLPSDAEHYKGFTDIAAGYLDTVYPDSITPRPL